MGKVIHNVHDVLLFPAQTGSVLITLATTGTFRTLGRNLDPNVVLLITLREDDSPDSADVEVHGNLLHNSG